MTHEQEEAVEWLRSEYERSSINTALSKHLTTILAMLREPRLPRPEDVPSNLYLEVAGPWTDPDGARLIYAALYDHYTKPREVWRVTYGGKLSAAHEDFATQEEAAEYAKSRLLAGWTVTITKGDA